MVDPAQFLLLVPLFMWLILVVLAILFSVYLYRNFVIKEFTIKLPIQVKIERKSKEQTIDIERQYSEGIRALLLGNWEKSVSAFRRVVVSDPNYRDASLRLVEAERFLKKEQAKRLAELGIIGAILFVLISAGILISGGGWRARMISWLGPSATPLSTGTVTPILTPQSPTPIVALPMPTILPYLKVVDPSVMLVFAGLLLVMMVLLGRVKRRSTK